MTHHYLWITAIAIIWLLVSYWNFRTLNAWDNDRYRALGHTDFRFLMLLNMVISILPVFGTVVVLLTWINPTRLIEVAYLRFNESFTKRWKGSEESYARYRSKRRELTFRPNYSTDERRVAAYLCAMSKHQIGAGTDPIGFLITSHRADWKPFHHEEREQSHRDSTSIAGDS